MSAAALGHIRSCYNAGIRDENTGPSGSRGRVGVRISNLPPWLSLLCMVIYISVVETIPNHRRSKGGLSREAAEALFRVAQGAGRETTPFLAFVALAVLLSFWLSALYRADGLRASSW